ncbi:glycerophosphodiester phosphodiesterase [Flavobacterium sp. N2270]|uniref:glycerophosphodiester phosphodiesterase n=1 Tax=Flavobacterium sp. N2270 TaxID=2986831 RepID=UPI0022255353|nr:glycerophosphodiester phosphodiesterase family protein [Flavobacterium sp. N2270]
MIQSFGHRGAKGYVSENTLASFQKALDLNVYGIELDVHVCASGELVVFHDFTLDRITNGSGEIHNFSLEELKKLKVDGVFEIPTLEEVLNLINRKCKVNIELKGHDTAKPALQIIEKYIQEYNWKMENFIVSSFQRDELYKVSQLNSNVPLAVLTQASVEQAMEWADEFSAKYIHPHFSLLTEDNCKMATEKGFKINTWTVDDVADIERIKKYKINGIISDFPDRI